MNKMLLFVPTLMILAGCNLVNISDIADTEDSAACNWRLPDDNYTPCETYHGVYFNGTRCIELTDICERPAGMPFLTLRDCQNNCLSDNGDAGKDVWELTEEECLARGGTWKIWGLAPEESCNIPTSDAGKTCRDSSECESSCITNPGATGEVITGGCHAWINLIGLCFQEVENGQPGKAICID